MTIPEILDELQRVRVPFPRQAVEEAVAQREAITPELLRILERDTARLAEIAPDEEYMAHLYAMYLLAQFREPRAYPLLVSFLHAEDKLVDMTLGDVLTEDMGRMLAAVCGGDTRPVEEMIEDPEIDEYVRAAGMDAWVVLMVEGEKTRDEVMAYFRDLFHGKLPRDGSFVWGHLVWLSCDLWPGEVMEEIEQACADDLVDPFIIDAECAREEVAKDREAVLAKVRRDPRRHFIEDTVREMEGWPCFEPPWKIEPPPLPKVKVNRIPQVVVPKGGKPKVRRNDPCPCGSGKKYKVCCGFGGK